MCNGPGHSVSGPLFRGKIAQKHFVAAQGNARKYLAFCLERSLDYKYDKWDKYYEYRALILHRSQWVVVFPFELFFYPEFFGLEIDVSVASGKMKVATCTCIWTVLMLHIILCYVPIWLEKWLLLMKNSGGKRMHCPYRECILSPTDVDVGSECSDSVYIPGSI